MLEQTVVNFVPTGMIPTRARTPHVPVHADEIVTSVRAACELGISMVHLHTREPDSGRPTLAADIYAEIIAGIREFAPTLVICVSLSGRECPDAEIRSAPLRLQGAVKPDMASLTLSSLNFNRLASINPPETIQLLATRMNEAGIMPEFEAFDAGMINYARYLAKKGLVRPPYYFNLILGNIACAQADLLHTGVMLRDLPEDSNWSLGGIGDSQLPMNAIAIAAGGGVRVGLEDALHFDRSRRSLATNLDLLRRVHALAAIHDRPVMPPEDLRRLLKLEDGRGRYGRKATA